MHVVRIAALHEVRRVPVTYEQSFQLFMADASQDRRIVAKSAAWNRTIPEERAHGAADEIHTLT